MAWHITNHKILESNGCAKADAEEVVMEFEKMYFAGKERALIKFEDILKAMINFYAAWSGANSSTANWTSLCASKPWSSGVSANSATIACYTSFKERTYSDAWISLPQRPIVAVGGLDSKERIEFTISSQSILYWSSNPLLTLNFPWYLTFGRLLDCRMNRPCGRRVQAGGNISHIIRLGGKLSILVLENSVVLRQHGSNPLCQASLRKLTGTIGVNGSRCQTGQGGSFSWL